MIHVAELASSGAAGAVLVVAGLFVAKFVVRFVVWWASVISRSLDSLSPKISDDLRAGRVRNPFLLLALDTIGEER